MEYETDWAGEAEIAGWEIASGCGRHGWAWLLNLGAFTVGLALFPRRLYRAFLRGRHARNLYRDGFPETELPRKTVQWLREYVGTNGETKAGLNDRLAFGAWSFISLAYHGAFVVGGLACLYALVKLLT